MKKKFLMHNVILWAGILFTAVIFSSCLKSNDNNNPQTDAAGIMAFNLSPGKSAIGIELSGNNLTNDALAYGNYTGGYLSIYTGARSVSAFDAGSGSPFTSTNFTFEKNKYYSLFVVGNNDNYDNVIVNDKLDSLSSASGKAFIRYINAIPDSSGPLVTVMSNGNSVINQNAAFASVSDFVEIAPGDAVIAISNSNHIQANRTISLEQRKVYTVLFSGVPGTVDSAQSVQIKYIENGTLSEDSTARGVSMISPRSVRSY